MAPEPQPPQPPAAPAQDAPPAAAPDASEGAAHAPAQGTPPPAPETLSARVRRLKAADIVQGAGAAAASAALIYVVGGMVMWLRFRKAGLPADHAVALMERQQLLVIGLRLMVLPAALTGAFALLLMRLRTPDRDAMTVAARRWHSFAKTLLIVVAVAVALMLPFSFASATWVLAALVIVGYWRYERRPPGAPASPPAPARPVRPGRLGTVRARAAALLRAARNRAVRFGPRLPLRRRRTQRASPWVVTALVMVVAAVVSLGRQLDQPVQLLSASITVKDSKEPIEGSFISADGSDVYIGVDRRVQAVPRSTIDLVSVGPPRDRAPRSSLASMLLGGGRYAITPFAWWCDGEHYEWDAIGDLCQTQLRVYDDSMGFDGPRFVPVKLRCPQEAKAPCQGLLRLVSRHRYVFGNAGVPRPVVFSAPIIPAHTPGITRGIPPGRVLVVCLKIDSGQRGLLRNAIPDGEAVPDTHAQFDLEVFSDASGGGNVTLRDSFTINVPRPGLREIPEFGDCTSER